jgi:hypothetical protein
LLVYVSALSFGAKPSWRTAQNFLDAHATMSRVLLKYKLPVAMSDPAHFLLLHAKLLDEEETFLVRCVV